MRQGALNIRLGQALIPGAGDFCLVHRDQGGVAGHQAVTQRHRQGLLPNFVIGKRVLPVVGAVFDVGHLVARPKRGQAFAVHQAVQRDLAAPLLAAVAAGNLDVAEKAGAVLICKPKRGA